ncbi:recombinase family protein [Nonomuraea recticatena]|uniref:recombinase family protein n=1 Tax=Nonomuraea recticatena TaxID=46178 RepID=UPI0031F90031
MADQFAFMSASVARFGGEVVACFSDLGRPGDGLLALTQAAARGRMDRVMVWGLEPLGRQNADLVAALTGLHDHGVRVTLAGTGEEVTGAFVAASVSLEAAGLDAARARAARRRRGEAP